MRRWWFPEDRFQRARGPSRSQLACPLEWRTSGPSATPEGTWREGAYCAITYATTMIPTRTYRLEHYALTCSAEPCDNGMFQPALVITKNSWPSRPRTIAVTRDRYATAEIAIESAHAQGLEWIRNFG